MKECKINMKDQLHQRCTIFFMKMTYVTRKCAIHLALFHEMMIKKNIQFPIRIFVCICDMSYNVKFHNQ